jgi:hypothetical protein
MPGQSEYYRSRIGDCCLRAVIAEDFHQRLHWLEAATRWVSLAREDGLLRIKGKSATDQRHLRR